MHSEYVNTFFTVQRKTFPKAFAIATAHNPMGMVQADVLNTAADEAFLADLHEHGFEHFEIIGRSKSGDHQEPGWGIICHLEAAKALARKYDQEAIFWVVDDQLILIDLSDDSETPVGRFTARII